MTFASATEYVTAQTGRSLTLDYLPWSFLPPPRHQHRRFTTDELSKTRLTGRPQRFTRSRRFIPFCALRACFISQPRTGFPFQGLPPLQSRNWLITSPFPLVVSDPPLTPAEANIARIGPPRLQGFEQSSGPLPPAEWLNPANNPIPS
jgi:hypothetical protein